MVTDVTGAILEPGALVSYAPENPRAVGLVLAVGSRQVIVKTDVPGGCAYLDFPIAFGVADDLLVLGLVNGH
jgi:hypothetical protein